MAEQSGSAANSPGSGNRNVLLGMAAVAIVFTIVVASIGLGLPPSLGISSDQSGSSSGSTSSTTAAVDSPSGPPALCSGLTPEQELINAKVLGGSGERVPNYDEQLLLGFEQNFTSTLSYNVTLRAQNDSFGFGPVYLLNGLTDSGYWYQAGVAWNLGLISGGQFAPGFRFVYEVWNTAAGIPVFPQAGGTLPARFIAGDGDVALLSLDITTDGRVSMSALDWNTSSKAVAGYDGFGASEFLGFKDKVTSFPTSLLTEWYHVLPYFCSDRPVVYSNDDLVLSTAWLRIDEWNLTGVSTAQRFNSSAGQQCCVFSTAYQGVNFHEPEAFRSLTTNGTTIYANAHKFVTP